MKQTVPLSPRREEHARRQERSMDDRFFRFVRWPAVIVLLVLVTLTGVWMTRRHLAMPRTEILLRNAIVALEARQPHAAAELLDQVLAREPANYKALLYRGQAAREETDDAGALQFWGRITDDHPSEAGTARFLEGQLAFARNRSAEAERLLRRATDLHPTFLPPRERLAQLYLLQLRDAEMRREMLAIRAQRPWSLTELIPSLGCMGKIFPLTARTRQLERFVAADPEDVPSLLALAECLIADDRHDEAVELLERSIQAQPRQLALRGRLAELFVSRASLERARDVLGTFPTDVAAPVELWRGCGAYCAAMGEWASAAEYFEHALRLEPEHIRTAHAAGLAFEHVDRHAEATTWLTRARVMEQAILQAWRIGNSPAEKTQFLQPIAVEVARQLMELGRPFDATAWLEQALTWNSADPAARSLYAAALQQAQSEPVENETARPADRRIFPLPGTPLPVASNAPRSNQAATPAVTSSVPALELVDRHREAGLEFQYENGASGSKFLPESLGGGVAACDFDADGWPDLYFTQGGELPASPEGNDRWRDRFFRNLGGRFEDITTSAGLGDTHYSQGCAAADYDNDGFSDLAVANLGSNVLYRSNGDGTFSDVTGLAGIQGDHWHSSLAFSDLDRDGNLDLYVVTYVLDPYRICRPTPDRIATCSPLNFLADQDQLYRNLGDGTFADVSASAGILAEGGKGLGVVAADFDDDGWPDIYVTNDGTPNFLFHNETGRAGGELQLLERGLLSGTAVSGAGNSQAGMGIACGDLDGNGLLDLFVTNFYLESGTLYRNDGGLLFTDATRAARLDDPTRYFLGFGTQPLDVDLDGRLELFVANGHIDDFGFRGEPWKMCPQLFYNAGEGVFIDCSQRSGDYFSGQYLGRGVARLDWDRDGRPEVVVVHQDRPAALLWNQTTTRGRRLILDLHGVASNRDGIGARIYLTCDGETRIHEINGGDGFFATNERRVVLGLGDAATVDRLQIRWPSGHLDTFENLPAETAVVLIEGRPPSMRQLGAEP